MTMFHTADIRRIAEPWAGRAERERSRRSGVYQREIGREKTVARTQPPE